VVRILGAACLLACAVAHAGDVRLKLSAPGELVGDGQAVTLKLTVDPPQDLGALTLETDAGLVGASRQTTPGVYEIEFTPPRVAVALDVHVSAVLPGRHTPPTVMRVLPAPLPAGELRSGGALDLRGPARVLLGSATPVTITLKKTAKPPALAVNVGKLEAPQATGDRWTVRWQPPREKYPQVAVFGALDASGSSDWLVIPLYGVGRIEAKTKPGARLVVRVGDTGFGPFHADAAGEVVASVIAPPGTSSGTSHAVDRVGNEKDSPIDLGTPPFSRVLAMCTPQLIDVFAADPTGAPGDTAPLSATAGGAPVTLNRVAPGHARAPLPVASRAVEVRVHLGRELQAHCTVAPGAAPPRGLRVTLEKPRWRAGDPPVEVHALLETGAGQAKIVLQPDLGTVSDVSATAVGVQGRWHPPDKLAGHTTARISARVEGTELRGEAELALDPGPPARLDVEAPKAVTGDGHATARLKVRAQDAFGNPAAVTSPKADDGRSELRGVDAGVATLDWRAPSIRKAADTDVALRDETGAAGSVRVHLRAPRRPFGLGLHLGYLTNFARLNAALITLDFAWRLPWLRRNLSIGATAGVYVASYTAPGTEPVDVGVTAVPLLARVDYQIPLGPAALFAGVGGGVLLPVVSAKSATAALTTTTEVAGAFAARVGTDLDVRFGRVVVEVGYWYAPVSNAVVSGNFGGLSVLAGWRVEL
jgi:hypothetical protein